MENVYESVHKHWFLSPYTGFIPLTNEVNQEQWMTPWMVEESENGQIEAGIKKAEELLGKGGFESSAEYFQLCRDKGVTISLNLLDDIWNEFWSKHQ